MTMQLKQSPDTNLAMRIDADLMGPPRAPLVMPKQILTQEPGQFSRMLRLIQSRLAHGRQSLRRAG